MKRVASTPWGNVVVDSSIQAIPRWKQYLQGEVWQGYAGFMNLTDMSTTHLRNLEKFLLERSEDVVRQARLGSLVELSHESRPTFLADAADLLDRYPFIDTIDDVPLVVAVRDMIAKREASEYSPEVRHLEAHLRWVRAEIDHLADNEERTRQRLYDLTGRRY